MKIKQFRASDYTVWSAKKLMVEKGILSRPNMKPGNSRYDKRFLCF